MEFQTVETWDELLWNDAEKIYEDAFPAHSRKKRTIIQKMFEQKMCFLHIAYNENEMVAMALSGKVDNPEILILDYIAVKKNYQHHGIGRKFVEYIKNWSKKYEKFSIIVVEVEADEGPINEKRIEFWTKCDFRLTDYVHSYIWVPEKYKAMYYTLISSIPPEGQELFSYITEFHKKGYRGT
ncbi:MAG: GNAT family N-acetyltransferase [Heyndrickxia sp.]